MLLYYYTAITIITFLVWGWDKTCAVRHIWRIPERWLLGLALTGGAYGALAGMLTFRHKIRKLYFWIWVGVGCLIHVLVILYIVQSGWL